MTFFTPFLLIVLGALAFALFLLWYTDETRKSLKVPRSVVRENLVDSTHLALNQKIDDLLDTGQEATILTSKKSSKRSTSKAKRTVKKQKAHKKRR